MTKLEQNWGGVPLVPITPAGEDGPPQGVFPHADLGTTSDGRPGPAQ